MRPYIPGKPIEETRREYNLKKIIKLASNENPLGPSPKALVAIVDSLRELHRYPDGSCYELKQALAQHLNTVPSSLFIGNGSNEIIDLIIRAFCIPGDFILTAQAAFIVYKLCAQIHGAKTIEIPISDQFQFDLMAMVEQIKQNDKIKIVFLANPNNPTGTFFDHLEIRKFLTEVSKVRQGAVLVVIDAAYIEYLTHDNASDPTLLFKEFTNLIVLRTFSKIYGLAGLRIGYAVGKEELLSTLEKVRQPFNVNTLAVIAATHALKDQEFVKNSKEINTQGRLFWEKNFVNHGITFWKTQGNFVLVNTQKSFGKSGAEVYLECLKHGIIFRPLANYGLNHALRISIGLPEENQVALDILMSQKDG
ncbi:MAG: histidinol-phosphate transaminase [Deltaproteobacteria bacterium]|nr:histidinol-phosphate transaminase [Deltaproteobacteria bacterium]